MASDIHFGEPCGQRWADMPARDAGRYCARCDQTVLDLSRMTRRDALERMRGGVCGRVRIDADGAPVFKREPQRLGVRALAVLGALSGGCASAATSSPERVETVDDPPLAAGAAMHPVAAAPVPEGVAVDDLSDELLASYDERLEDLRSPEPTEEQRRLTAAKRRRHTAAAQPPPQQTYMGMMVFDPDL